MTPRPVGCLPWVLGILPSPCIVQVLGEQLARRGVGGEALKPLLARCLADVQGRLIFRAQVRAYGLECGAFSALMPQCPGAESRPPTLITTTMPNVRPTAVHKCVGGANFARW